MHRSSVVCVLCWCMCIGGLLVGVVGSNDATHPAASAQPSPNVNTTVSKVIDAMLADGHRMASDGLAIPIPEHHHDKAQRIVPRKGVDNDGSPSVVGSSRLMMKNPPVPASTSQSASVVASDEKPTVTSTEVPAVAVAKLAHTDGNATRGGVNNDVATNSSASTVHSQSPLPLANATKTSASSATAGASTSSSSSSSSSSTSAIAVSSSTAAPPQSKAAVTVGGVNTTRSANSTSSGSTLSTASTISTTSATTSSTTTTTTTTTTSTTTTKPPTKPKVTYSVEDEPKLLQAAKPGYSSPYDPVDSSGRLRVDEPLAQFSKEYIPSEFGGRDAPNSRREYVVPVVTLIFAIPLLLGLFLLSYRRAKEFWLTRHYRRMDFLIDGMYNY